MKSLHTKRTPRAGSQTWIQTDSKKGWFSVLRLYSPLESFFDKSWRPSEIEVAK